MQKDFEEEQEKNRKKEEEVMRIFSYLKWNLSDSWEVLIYGKWIYGYCVPQDTHAAWRRSRASLMYLEGKSCCSPFHP